MAYKSRFEEFADFLGGCLSPLNTVPLPKTPVALVYGGSRKPTALLKRPTITLHVNCIA